METVVLTILIILIMIGIYRTFEPCIDILQIEDKKFRVILWFNKFNDTDVERDFIKLFEYKI